MRNTRDRLLQTAIILFSARGFDGVSVNDIVQRARVNKRIVYHYFRSKAQLYQEALSFAYDELSAFEQEAIGNSTALKDVVRQLIRVYFEFPRLHPEFTQLMLWGNLNKGRGIRDSRGRLSKSAVVDRLAAASAGARASMPASCSSPSLASARSTPRTATPSPKACA